MSGMQANKNGHTKVFALRGTRSVQKLVPNDREQMTILSAISASGDTIPNYYVIKGTRPRVKYISLCEEGATMGMQKKGWMNSYLFSLWMDHFINSMTKRGISHLFKGIL